MKFMSDEKNAALLAQPDNLAQFRTTSLATALGLSDDQTQQIGTALNGYYQTFFSQGLNWDARPDTDFDAWNGRRGDLSQQAAADIVSPPHARAGDQVSNHLPAPANLDDRGAARRAGPKLYGN